MAALAITTVPAAWALSLVPHFGKLIYTRMKGRMDNAKPRDVDFQQKGMCEADKEFFNRLRGAHVNQLENLGYYAAGVALAVAVKVPDDTLRTYTGGYIASRIVYICAYAAPQVAGGVARTASYAGAMACIGFLYMAAANTVANGAY